MAQRLLLAASMHPLTFEVKRAHWRTTWTAIELYRDAGIAWKEATLEDMTPAGCDVLQAVWDHESDDRAEREARGDFSGGRKMPLAKLRAQLGLAGSTVWKCVQRLAGLHWVDLCPDREKKRRVVVWLTELGVHALRMAQKCAVTNFVDEAPQLRECMYGRLDYFVALDAERQDLVAMPGDAPIATEASRAGDAPAPAASTQRDADALRDAPPAPSAAPIADAPQTGDPPPAPTSPGTAAKRRAPPPKVARLPTPRTRRSFASWHEYAWWLVEHVRGLAQYFGSDAGRLYFREARHQVVDEQDDTWFFFDEETDEEYCEDEDDQAYDADDDDDD